AHRRQLATHLDAMLALCETAGCRREQMLNYFGEQAGACGNCDTCQSPPQTWDGTIPAQKLLSAVYRLRHERNQKFGAGHVIDILLGKTTPRVTQFQHDSLTVFGIGTELREAEWRGVVRQLLAQGLLAVEPDYGALVLTASSREVLSQQREVPLRREQPRPARSRSAGSGGQRAGGRTAAVGPVAPEDLSPEARELFEELRAWRAGVAREQGLPAYVIFQDKTLRQIAAERPATLAQLSTISGVGEAKLAKYGDQVLDVIPHD
ncbi:MAG TPA: RQC domain-containing protein, partial [Streptosporangiaceae bacterium]|nr:RQC domain-containing protein [Streptosporangiaceae bacterium]